MGHGKGVGKILVEALAPDVILANAPPSVIALQQVTQSLPIVFVGVTEPVGMGIVQSFASGAGSSAPACASLTQFRSNHSNIREVIFR